MTARMTPVFIGEMRYIEFSPYWNVPPAILRSETVPRLERGEAAMEAGKTSTAVVKQSIPVVLFYTTAIVDSAGLVLFESDIYGYDRKLEQALRAR